MANTLPLPLLEFGNLPIYPDPYAPYAKGPNAYESEKERYKEECLKAIRNYSFLKPFFNIDHAYSFLLSEGYDEAFLSSIIDQETHLISSEECRGKRKRRRYKPRYKSKNSDRNFGRRITGNDTC